MISLLFCSKDRKLEPLLSATLGEAFRVAVEANVETITSMAARGMVDVLILDFDSVYGSREEHITLFDQVRQLAVPIVLMTDDDMRSTTFELIKRGGYEYFRKPPSVPELKVIVRRAHENALLKRELEMSNRLSVATQAPTNPSCDQLVGSSAKSRITYGLIHRVRNINATVLVTGESGTGKELIARAIHNESDRAGKPFVAVSCGAIPETLIESELFGHEKGAFTGTVGMRTGFLEQAGDGTLFLDEIGELSLNTQVKLLRVLQQREFCRLGSSRVVPLRARMVFATHRDLPRMVEEGTFRQDLFFRINVMKIHAVPLRDNLEDLPLLANHFLRRYAELYQRPELALDPAALAQMLSYMWPGNIRELENVIQSAVIMADGPSIGPEDLPGAFHNLSPRCIDDSEEEGSFELQLRDFKVKLAMKAVENAAGNKTEAARKLNISRAYLHRLIRGGDDDVTIN
jgi:DNA-binding NtrC family response regulator